MAGSGHVHGAEAGKPGITPAREHRLHPVGTRPRLRAGAKLKPGAERAPEGWAGAEIPPWRWERLEKVAAGWGWAGKDAQQQNAFAKGNTSTEEGVGGVFFGCVVVFFGAGKTMMTSSRAILAALQK